jgi:hypothetical protein
MRRSNFLLLVATEVAIAKVIGYYEDDVGFAAAVGALGLQTNRQASSHKNYGKKPGFHPSMLGNISGKWSRSFNGHSRFRQHVLKVLMKK